MAKRSVFKAKIDAANRRERRYTTEQRMIMRAEGRTPPVDVLDLTADIATAGGKLAGPVRPARKPKPGRAVPDAQAGQIRVTPAGREVITVTGTWHTPRCPACNVQVTMAGPCALCTPGECDGTPLGDLAKRFGMTPGQVAVLLTSKRDGTYQPASVPVRTGRRVASTRKPAPKRKVRKGRAGVQLHPAMAYITGKDHGLWGG